MDKAHQNFLKDYFPLLLHVSSVIPITWLELYNELWKKYKPSLYVKRTTKELSCFLRRKLNQEGCSHTHYFAEPWKWCPDEKVCQIEDFVERCRKEIKCLSNI